MRFICAFVSINSNPPHFLSNPIVHSRFFLSCPVLKIKMRLLLGPLAFFLASFSGVLATPLIRAPDATHTFSHHPPLDTVMAVVGGDEVSSAANYPFIVGIESRDGRNFCGGTLINARQVLTAAHCVANSRASDIQVRGGTRHRSEGGKVYDVKTIHINPGYATRAKPNDMAILDLKKKVTASWYAPASLPNTTAPLAPGERVEVVGWGRTRESDPTSRPRTLRHRRLSVLDFSVCRQYYASTTSPQNFCTRRSSQEGTGSGDSGGPLLQGNVLRGTVGGSREEPGFPGYHVNVGAHLDWIQSRWL
jgi:secreted trypsin-like serine protease